VPVREWGEFTEEEGGNVVWGACIVRENVTVVEGGDGGNRYGDRADEGGDKCLEEVDLGVGYQFLKEIMTEFDSVNRGAGAVGGRGK